jgi:hypothetical protein
MKSLDVYGKTCNQLAKEKKIDIIEMHILLQALISRGLIYEWNKRYYLTKRRSK